MKERHRLSCFEKQIKTFERERERKGEGDYVNTLSYLRKGAEINTIKVKINVMFVLKSLPILFQRKVLEDSLEVQFITFWQFPEFSNYHFNFHSCKL